MRALFEAVAARPDAADRLADEALSWARRAGDDWTIAMAARAGAMAARGSEQLHDRVAGASTLLERAGNLFHLAGLLASSAYAALGLGDLADASEFVGRALPIAQRLDNPTRGCSCAATSR
ncbi:MAG: hypothetical protein ABI611_19445 [Solirubrobacteraceae bacterium]